MDRNRLIGVAVTPSIPYDRAIVAGVAEYALQKGRWAFRTAYGQPYLPREQVLDWEGDGLIGTFDEDLMNVCRARNIPCVSVMTSSGKQVVPSVIVDHRAVGRLAAEHLLSKGLKRFAVLAPKTGQSLQNLSGRVVGFEQTVQAAGRTVDRLAMGVRLAPGETTPDLDVTDIAAYLAKQNEPLGIFTLHDYAARIVAETCIAAGLRVPDDVSVIGEGNWAYDCTMARPTLSSIDIGAERIGYRAAELLDKLMAGGRRPTRPVLVPPVRVIERQSTDVLAIDDQEVREAIRFIRSHETEPIQMSDVLRVVPISRRSLETRFRKAVGCSVHEEIRRRRIAWACRMLVDTDLPVVRIFEAGAYAGQDRFHAAFKRETGLTPLEYRRKHRG